MRNSLKKRLFAHLYSILVMSMSCIFALVQKKNNLFSDQERGNEYGPLRPHHHNIQWAIAAPSSQHSMGHFSVVFVKTKIFDGPFNFCMGHLHRITKCMYQTAHENWESSNGLFDWLKHSWLAETLCFSQSKSPLELSQF
jgi:hypothetical protein